MIATQQHRSVSYTMIGWSLSFLIVMLIVIHFSSGSIQAQPEDGPHQALRLFGLDESTMRQFIDGQSLGMDEHEPLLFTVGYGQGRVFQNALGHTAEQLKSVAFIVPFQRGAEWAATGKVTQKVPDDFPGPEKASVRD